MLTAVQPAFYDAKLPWFGTARGRLGYSVGSTLFYGTGGAAYGSVKTNVVTAATNETFTTTKTGWTAGAGIETPFTLFNLFGPSWTSKTEYLYVDLGSVTNTFAAGAIAEHHQGHRPRVPHRHQLSLQSAGGRQVLRRSDRSNAKPRPRGRGFCLRDRQRGGGAQPLIATTTSPATGAPLSCRTEALSKCLTVSPACRS